MVETAVSNSHQMVTHSATTSSGVHWLWSASGIPFLLAGVSRVMLGGGGGGCACVRARHSGTLRDLC